MTVPTAAWATLERIDMSLEKLKSGLRGWMPSEHFAPVLLAVGGAVLLAGLWFLWQAVSSGDTGTLDQAVERSEKNVAGAIAATNQAMDTQAVVEAARAALADPDGATGELRRVLRAAGVPNVLDAQVYPPNIEDIEAIGYPGPDFAVIEALLSASRQGRSPAQIHHPGSANENLAFAHALEDADREGKTVGYLFVRLPVSTVARRLAPAGHGGWLGLRQDSALIASEGHLPGGREPDNFVPIDGSSITLEWAWTGAWFGPSPFTSGLLAVFGALLLAAGLLSRRIAASAASRPDKSTRQAAPAPATPAPGKGSKQPSSDRLPKPEKRAEPKPSDDEVPFDVPDLDEIYRRIDAREGGAETSASERPGADRGVQKAAAHETASLPDGLPESAGLELTLENESDRAAADKKSSGAPAAPPDAGFDFDMDLTLAPQPDLEDEPAPAADAEFAEDGSPDDGEQQKPLPGDEPFPSGIFRPTQILGVVDEDLDADVAVDIGRAVGSMAARRGLMKIAVGRDGRFSGPVLLSALIRGIRSTGVAVVEIGAVPTPLLWFAATELANGCGVMVTASHHPSRFNGFRIMLGGQPFDEGEMTELAALCSSRRFAEGEGDYSQHDVFDAYAERYVNDVQLERSLKVVVDCGNGVGGTVVPRLLTSVGAEVIPLYCDVDGAFPNHQPDPTEPDELQDLRLCVRNFQADLGIAFDGDADRLVLMTPAGEIVWPDRMLMLLAERIVPARPDEAVVFDARCSGKLRQVVESAGGRGVMAGVGRTAVARRLLEEQALLGGDMDGHLFVNDRWYAFDDAIYAAARLLAIVAAGDDDLDDLVSRQPAFRSSPAVFVDVERTHAQALVERLRSEGDFGDALITGDDSLRAEWANRWGLAYVDDSSGRLVLCFGADEPTALGQVRNDFRDRLLALDAQLPLPY